MPAALRAQSGATIAAIASPVGGATRGVIRLSGDEALRIAETVWDCGWPAAARGVFEGQFKDGVGSQPGLLIWMPGPRSFTREDVVEFHLSGSPFLLQSALARLLALGARVAEPGEFTRRAFVNGRIDLARAEGILELIEARDRAQRRSATALLFGGLSRRIESLRDELANLRALCEASLDFDDADTGHVEDAELQRLFDSIHTALTEAENWEARRGDGFALPRVVLAGNANAGKSSLFNALAGERAIVSDLAGTTRDVLRATWTLAKSSFQLIDTAGLEDAEPEGHSARAELERALRRKAEEARDSADLCLWVVDATNPGVLEPPVECAYLLVWNKCDDQDAAAPPMIDAVVVSARTGRGLKELGARACEQLGPAAGGTESLAVGGLDREISARHRASLGAALETLEAGQAAWEAGTPLELFADHLRRASDCLDGITGQTTPEDLLDRIFGQFCLGK